MNIDIAIALDLNPIFDSTLNGTDRLPNPSLRINTFDVEGVFGVNEWTTSLQLPPPLDDFKILVSEAKALVNISVEIPRENTPLIIGSKDDFLAFITPSSHSSNSSSPSATTTTATTTPSMSSNSSLIDLSVGLDVIFPVFVIVNDFGFGATISYQDENILDDQRQQPTIDTDVLIGIDLIKSAVEELKNTTSFLRDTKVLAEKIPLIQKSVNQLIAGEDRTFADLFDLTEWAEKLTGTNQATEAPSISPSKSSLEPSLGPSTIPSNRPSAIPSLYPSALPSIQPSASTGPSASFLPSSQPSFQPSSQPSQSSSPTTDTLATESPTSSPSRTPTSSPSRTPTSSPTTNPSRSPSKSPTSSTSALPSTSTFPSGVPSLEPTQSRNSEFILLSELKNEFIEALKSLTKPDKADLGEVPPLPDADVFNVTMPMDAFCAGNDRALSVDIVDDDDGLTITLCALLEFDLSGSFDADGLLNEFEDYLSLSVSGDYNLMGAFTFGCQLVVSGSIAEDFNVSIEFDPMTAQLYVDGGLEAVVSFGMIEAIGSASASLSGDFGLVYCSDCSGTHSDSDYIQASENSTFYLKREAGYSALGGLGIRTEIPGVSLETGLEFGIADTNVFDDEPATVTLPDAQALRDSLKFSNQMAVNMLRLIDMVSWLFLCS